MLECSRERPWGVHQPVRNDAVCRRCGWTAPGPAGDARLDAEAARIEALARAEALGWDVIDGGDEPDAEEALAA
ncbi:MAG: hypothetical protein JOZ90_01525 [Alphaproteobacteria bacterium]|nr:hypothetical protein [Alphaproteobacteria bacterium]MBV9370271.1 hypothetical protein [Alphaproteobacteria bacterium]MBV9899756.1 hypothetical protein [Alphaproteobacteria bacterium]